MRVAFGFVASGVEEKGPFLHNYYGVAFTVQLRGSFPLTVEPLHLVLGIELQSGDLGGTYSIEGQWWDMDGRHMTEPWIDTFDTSGWTALRDFIITFPVIKTLPTVVLATPGYYEFRVYVNHEQETIIPLLALPSHKPL